MSSWLHKSNPRVIAFDGYLYPPNKRGSHGFIATKRPTILSGRSNWTFTGSQAIRMAEDIASKKAASGIPGKAGA